MSGGIALDTVQKLLFRSDTVLERTANNVIFGAENKRNNLKVSGLDETFLGLGSCCTLIEQSIGGAGTSVFSAGPSNGVCIKLTSIGSSEGDWLDLGVAEILQEVNSGNWKNLILDDERGDWIVLESKQNSSEETRLIEPLKILLKLLSSRSTSRSGAHAPRGKKRAA